MGGNGRQTAPTGVFRILAYSGENLELSLVADENNFEIYEKMGCICEKMGYNRME